MSKRFVITLVAFVALVVAGVVALTLPLVVPGTDSGVATCQQISDNMHKGGAGSTNYAALRKAFNGSQYVDIKTAGNNLVNAVQLADERDRSQDTLGGALVLLSTLRSDWTSLQTACANHGVDVPAMPNV